MLKFLLGISLLFFVACTGPGAESGFAPGAAIEQPVMSFENAPANHVRHGEIVVTSNGWTVSSDNTDPVEQKTLSNGWMVEVKYE